MVTQTQREREKKKLTKIFRNCGKKLNYKREKKYENRFPVWVSERKPNRIQCNHTTDSIIIKNQWQQQQQQKTGKAKATKKN